MGCCQQKVQSQVFEKFEVSWGKFNKSELSNYDSFTKDKARVFGYFYYSISYSILIKIQKQVNTYYKNHLQDKDEKNKVKKEFLKIRNMLDKEAKQVSKNEQRFKNQVKENKIVKPKYQKLNKENKKAAESESERGLYQPQNHLKLQSEKSQERQQGKVEEIKYKNTSLMKQNKQKNISSFQKYQQQAVDKLQDQTKFYYSIPGSIISQIKQQGEQSKFIISKLQNQNKFYTNNDIKLLELKIQQLTNQFKRLNNQKQNLINQCGQKAQAIKSLREQINGFQEKTKLTHSNYSLRIQALTIQLQEIKNFSNILQKDNDQLRITNKILEKKYTELQSLKIQPLIIQKKEQQQKIINIKEQIEIKEKEDYKQQIIEDQTVKKNSFIKPNRQDSYNILLTHFNGSKILPNHHQFDRAVDYRKGIAEMFVEKIQQTNLVFAHDPIIPKNFKKYIQNRDNLLILIKLQSQVVLGAYAGKLIQGFHQDSFIFSLSPSRGPIKLKANKKIHKIDSSEGFIIFGYSQLKIKAEKLDLSCNLNNFQSIYDRVSYQKFMQIKPAQKLIMKSYQIYEIIFKP